MSDLNANSLGTSAGDGETTGAKDGATSEQDRIDRLNRLGESLIKKRSDAIAAREASGIETQWAEDEEFYAGVDDANRDEHRNAWRTKPPGQYTPQVKGVTRSTVFPNITRPYVDAAAARIADMLLPTDDRSWAIKPTPIPDLVDIAGGKIPPDIMKQLQAPVTPGGPPVAQTQVATAAQALIAQAKQEQEEAKAAADKAQTRIEDWNVEGQWHAEVRKVIEDAARCGAGVLKGPYPIKRKVVALVDVGNDGNPTAAPGILAHLVGKIKKMFGRAQKIAKALIVKEEIKPTSRRIDFWDFYPDGACGENIHDGAYCWERDRLTPKKLQELKGGDYIDSQIDACINEGPKKAVANTKYETDKYLIEADDKRFEIWYMHGVIGKEDLEAAGCEVGEDEHPLIPAIITIVNNRVIKAALNPLDSGDFPYDVMPWQRKAGMPWGDGVARQGRTAQRIVTAASRHLMDNAGLAAGPQIVLKQGAIEPADGQMNLVPRKIWYWGEDVAAGGDVDDIRKVMTFFNVPMMQVELNNIIQYGMKMMEDSTGLPMLIQGQQGKAPDTVGGMTMLNNNATAVLRRLARTFDDYVTEPHIRRYYRWLLQHGEDDSEKGDFTIDARGSSALVERDMQAQQMPQLLQFSGNPMYGIDPKKTMEELLKAWHLDAKRFQYDDEKWQQIVAGLAQKPGDPRVQVAQIHEQGETQRLQSELLSKERQAEAERQVKLMVERINERIEAMKLNGSKEISFEEMKSLLAETAIKVAAQRELGAANLAADIHKHHNPSPQVLTPPAEPAGRAKAGQAYSA